MLSSPVPRLDKHFVGDRVAAKPELIVAGARSHLKGGHPGTVQGHVLAAGAQLKIDAAVDHAVVAQHKRVQAANAVAAAGHIQHIAGHGIGNDGRTARRDVSERHANLRMRLWPSGRRCSSR